MGLKITSQLGTNRGITDQGYVKIINYTVDKSASLLNLTTNLYMNKEDADQYNSAEFGVWAPSQNNVASNVNIPTSLSFPLTSSVVETVEVYRPTQSLEWILFTTTDSKGNVTTGSRQEYVQSMVTESIQQTKYYKDTTLIENDNIFNVAYPLLKTYLEGVVGKGNVVDC